MSRKTRKLLWSAPLVAVLAVVGALAIFGAATPGGVFANPAPSGVTNFTVSSDGPTSIKLDWDPPAGGETPMGYRIDWAPSVSDGHDWSELVSSQTETEYTDTGLVPPAPITPDANVTRYYRVFAINHNGPGPESDILQESTKGVQLAGAIDDVKATASGAKTINVTWSPPDETGGLPITGYLVVAGNIAGTTTTDDAKLAGKEVDADVNRYAATEYWNPLAVGGAATAKLSAETTAHFRVFAMNAAGTSTENSNVDSATTSKANRPDPPMRLIAVQVQETTPSDGAYLYWHEPADDGGRVIAGYEIEHKRGSAKWVSREVTVGSGTFPTGPAFAQDYLHVPQGDDEETLEQGERVQYRVKAKHADGTSRVSNTATVSMVDTDAADMDDPRQPDAPTDLLVTDDLPGKIRLTWTHDLNTGYRIDVSEDGMVWQGLVRNTGLTLELGTTTSHRYDHEGLTPGDRRYYRVLANDGGIFSVAGLNTAQVGVAGLPENPGKTRSLSADLDANDPTQINVSWSGLAADDTGGAKIRRYLVEVSEDGTAFFAVRDAAVSTTEAGLDLDDLPGYVWVNVGKTSYQHKGLPANTRYHYRVRADNSANDADFTAEDNLTPAGAAQTATEKTPAPRKPGMPMSLSAHPAADSSLPGVGDRGVYVTWLKPAKVLGGEVTGYNIERRVADEDTLTDSVEGDRTFYQDTDNLVGQVRDYRISAESEAGSGPWTAWITYPIADHTHNTAPMAVGTIDPVTVTAGEMFGAMDVSGYFSDADMGDALTYTAMSDMEMYATADIPAGSSMLTITGVAAGMATITVTATDMDDAMATQTIMVTVTSSVLTAPSVVMTSDATENPGTLLVQVDWTPGAGAVGHLVMLFTDDWQGAPMVEGMPTGNSHTFTVDPGSYIAVVVAYDADGDIQLAISGVTSVGPS